MAAVTMDPLGRRGWTIACRVAWLELALVAITALVLTLTADVLDTAAALIWGGAVVILGRWLTAFAVFRQAGAMHAATALRAMMRGSVLTWGLAIASAPLAWNLCQLPPLPFLSGLVMVSLLHMLLPSLIERTTR